MDRGTAAIERIENDYIFEKIISILLFGMLANGIGFAIDKVLLIVCIGTLLVFNFSRARILFLHLTLLVFWLALASISSLVNLTFKPMIFFPAIGLFFVFIITQISWIESFHKVLFIYIFLSFCFGISAYIVGPNFTVSSLTTKGISFLMPFKGFTTTVQTFGTICIMWIVINFETGKKRFGFQFFIVLLSLILTFNRSSYLFVFIVLALYNRRFFWASALLLGMFLILFFKQITDFVFNTGTLQSREELLQGFYLSYWNDNSILGYMFGKGNNFYPPEIVSRVKWDHRPDIENGYALLLHTYGFIGLMAYLLYSASLLINTLFLKKSFRLFVVVSFYLFVTQYFTQEFVTNIFYLFIAAIVTLSNSSNEYIRN